MQSGTRAALSASHQVISWLRSAIAAVMSSGLAGWGFLPGRGWLVEAPGRQGRREQDRVAAVGGLCRCQQKREVHAVAVFVATDGREDFQLARAHLHRQNTIDRVSLKPDENSYVRHSVAGKPFTLQLIGPTNGKWGRGRGEYGRVAYFQADGGIKSPPPAAGGLAQPAAVLRVEF